MRNGSALAIGQINARGGIGGRLIEQVVIDVDVFSPEGVDRTFRQLFDEDVDAVTSGYVFPEDVAAGLAAQYGAPYLHAMTSQSQAETVSENQSTFRNVFQVCPTEVHYGPGFIRFLDQERDRGWAPPSPADRVRRHRPAERPAAQRAHRQRRRGVGLADQRGQDRRGRRR